ncbi:alpha-1,6-mannosyltransferase [Naumannella cuiyingiana]|uniref:Alpha-1,6-mannosyltransferase n=1 Tax=Naumannella cuiyingiana TaxID=1347891 RepID=A0A7Z0D9R3_9ACTN|nr:alpha-1,6-mannosyltransferase [Naumannella cuiyingiana]
MNEPAAAPVGRRRVELIAATALGAAATAALSVSMYGYLADADLWLRYPLGRALARLTGSGLNFGFAFCGILALTAAWLWLGRVRPAIRETMLILTIWALPMIFGPPVLSRDVYLYVEQGWQLLTGANPYTTGLGQGGPTAAMVQHWVGTTAVYPPLTLRIQQLVVTIAGADGYASVVGMRVPALAATVALAPICAALARRVGTSPARAVWWAVLNPLTMVHLVGGAHNDGPMVAVAALALLVAYRGTAGSFVAAAALAGVAGALKQPGLLFAVAVALIMLQRLDLPDRRRRWLAGAGLVAGAIAIAALAFLAVSALCGLGNGWLGTLSVPGSVVTFTPADQLAALIQQVGAAVEIEVPDDLRQRLVWPVRVVLLIALALLIRRYRRSPIMLMQSAMLAFTLAGPAMRGWYYLSGITLLGVAGSRRVLAVGTGIIVMTLTSEGFQETARVAYPLGSGLLGLTLGALAAVAAYPWLWPRETPGERQRVS